MAKKISKMSCACESGNKFEFGCIEGEIHEGIMSFSYDAYSCDSSFDGSDAMMEINFCPFCGRPLKGSNLPSDLPA